MGQVGALLGMSGGSERLLASEAPSRRALADALRHAGGRRHADASASATVPPRGVERRPAALGAREKADPARRSEA